MGFRHLCAAALSVGLLVAADGVLAQSYPNRTITFIVPYGPGGNADLAARSLASVAQKSLKQSVIVVNRAGAGGIIGSRSVVDAPKDGYTLLIARVGSQAVAPALDPATTYGWDSFTMLGLLELDPYVCVVSAKSPIHTVDELLQAIRKRPGALSFASTGNFDASVVFPIKIMLNAGMSPDAALKVPYKSTPETITAVISGQTDFSCNGLSPYLSNIQGGNLRALVVSTRTRVPDIADVPTAAEIGMPNLEVVSGWSALYGPPDLPREVVQRWTDELARIKKDPEWSDQPRKRGSLPSIMSPEETRKFVEEQYKAYKALAPQLAPR